MAGPATDGNCRKYYRAAWRGLVTQTCSSQRQGWSTNSARTARRAADGRSGAVPFQLALQPGASGGFRRSCQRCRPSCEPAFVDKTCSTARQTAAGLPEASTCAALRKAAHGLVVPAPPAGKRQRLASNLSGGWRPSGAAVCAGAGQTRRSAGAPRSGFQWPRSVWQRLHPLLQRAEQPVGSNKTAPAPW
jgi:hypothetical protein